jgi:hypothetical protein
VGEAATHGPGDSRGRNKEGLMSFVDYIKKGWEVVQLKVEAIKELAADEKGIGPAIGILAIGGLASGIGFFNPVSVIGFPIFWVVGGFLAVAIMHFVATTFFGGKGSFVGLAVPLFCASIISCVGIVPFLGPMFLTFLAGLWMIVVSVVCVENVYGVDRGKAIVVVAVPVLLGLIVFLTLGAVLAAILVAAGVLSS